MFYLPEPSNSEVKSSSSTERCFRCVLEKYICLAFHTSIGNIAFWWPRQWAATPLRSTYSGANMNKKIIRLILRHLHKIIFHSSLKFAKNTISMCFLDQDHMCVQNIAWEGCPRIFWKMSILNYAHPMMPFILVMLNATSGQLLR